MTKYKYNTINVHGAEEPWSGSFETKELADAWFEKWGNYHIARGHPLVLVEYEAKDNEEVEITLNHEYK